MTKADTISTALPVCSGQASLRVERVAGQSAVVSARATSPLKLLTPRSRGSSVWAYLSSFGGGLVAGDQTRVDLEIGNGAKCYVATQASTKVYRNPMGRACGQTTHAEVKDEAVLVYAPDVVQPFAGSTYRQRQTFQLAPTATLVLLDWLSSGRTERGEQWAFSHYQSRNEVFIGGRQRVIDSVCLGNVDSPLTAAQRMGHYHCLALMLLIGPQVAGAAASVIADIGEREVSRRAAVIASASPIENGVLLRMAGETVEGVRRELYRHLAFLADLLGDDPLPRKY